MPRPASDRTQIVDSVLILQSSIKNKTNCDHEPNS